mgnify:CR=1 FL=1
MDAEAAEKKAKWDAAKAEAAKMQAEARNLLAAAPLLRALLLLLQLCQQ